MNTARVVDREDLDQYVLNFCAKHLSRTSTDRRHDYGHLEPGDPRAEVSESWRFPIVAALPDDFAVSSVRLDEVTFVFAAAAPGQVAAVEVVGTFAPLYRRWPLRPIVFAGEETRYFAASLGVPRGEVHHYKYFVDGVPVVDPINPQLERLDNGEPWSRFFTSETTVPVSFTRDEYELLRRLVAHVLPFRTPEAQRFLEHHYFHLDREAKQGVLEKVYRLDQGVGAVNFIDNLVAREERHHLIDYKTCLRLIRDVLRARRPGTLPEQVSRELYAELYGEMAANAVPGWDYGRYQSPRYFLQVLRRHAYLGAFCHPKYGGNAGAAGWAFLSETFSDGAGRTLFAWRNAIEAPIGTSPDYRG